jgi:predicted nucleic acid-binding protein
MPADFADASLVAMAERLGLLQLASLDRDFDRYRAFGKRAFTNVFLGM